jgi:hypothetical protein
MLAAWVCGRCWVTVFLLRGWVGCGGSGWVVGGVCMFVVLLGVFEFVAGVDAGGGGVVLLGFPSFSVGLLARCLLVL